MARKKRYKEFSDFPKYKKMYMNAFEKMIKERGKRGLNCEWSNAQEVFAWYMEDENIPGQMKIEDFI